VDNIGQTAVSDINHTIELDPGMPPIQLALKEGDINKNYVLDTDETWIFEGKETAKAGTHRTVATVTGRSVEETDVAYYTGEAPSTATISGYKWNDLNGDGKWDTGELGVPGWIIFLDGQTTTTDAKGKYSFSQLPPGTYRISEKIRDDWANTYDGSTTVAVEGGDEFSGRFGYTEKLNFGNHRKPPEELHLAATINGHPPDAPGPTIFIGSGWLQCKVSSDINVGKVSIDDMSYLSGDENTNNKLENDEIWTFEGKAEPILGTQQLQLVATSDDGKQGTAKIHYVGQAIKSYTITPFPTTHWLSYTEIVALLKQWAKDAPEICEFFVYGQSSDGIDLTGLRVGNNTAPAILFESTKHGNEIRSTVATLWMLEKYLNDFGRDDEITDLLLRRNVCWVPAVSPDSYPNSRWVDGVDPNRNFPYPGRLNQPIPPIQALMDLYHKYNFYGVQCGHTYGRDYFYQTFGPAEDKRTVLEFGRRMDALTGYRTSQGGSSPNGYDHDWFYWQGAVSYVVEFGSGRSTPPNVAIDEGRKNYPAYMMFIEETPTIAKTLNPPAGDAPYKFSAPIGEVTELVDE
jgi:hypothetical protein